MSWRKNYRDGCRPLRINASTEAAVCQQAPGILWNDREFLYCPGQETSYCSWGRSSCSDESEEMGFAIGPICGDIPRTKPAVYGSLPIGYARSLNTDGSYQTMCTCPEGSLPDLASRTCIRSHTIKLQAFRTKPGGASPVALTARVFVTGQPFNGVSNEPVELSIIPSEGKPGTLIPATGLTDEGGDFYATYHFAENFQNGRIDTIRATCRRCTMPATVDLKISPTVIGFFNGVWNTTEQAEDGKTALESLIGPTYDGMEIQYESFYNQTGSGNEIPCCRTLPRSSISAVANSTVC